jgi:hypothetical protein
LLLIEGEDFHFKTLDAPLYLVLIYASILQLRDDFAEIYRAHEGAICYCSRNFFMSGLKLK